jgi:protein-tyrosine phosphatase
VAGIVDIHAHVLPGLDDGPADQAESDEVLRTLADEGVTTVVATPHVNAQFGVTATQIREAVEQLPGDLPVEVLPGAEVHLGQVDTVLQEDDPRVYTLAGRGTVLLEVDGPISVSTVDDARLRLAGAGLAVLVAHVERWHPLREDPSAADGLTASGACLQITAGALLGRLGPRSQRCAWSLLDRGKVHCVSSDTHALSLRPPSLAEAAEALDRRYGDGAAHVLMSENPAALARGASPPAFLAAPRRGGLLARLGITRR